MLIKSAGLFDLGLGNTAMIINAVSESKQEHLQLSMPDPGVTSSLSLTKDELILGDLDLFLIYR